MRRSLADVLFAVLLATTLHAVQTQVPPPPSGLYLTSASNVYGLIRLNPAYSGSIVKLRRSNDSAVADFWPDATNAGQQ
jgi:hypothetical protein